MINGNRKINVLFLASWFPNRLNKFEGLFVKKHALAASMFSNVSVLYVALDPHLKEKYEVASDMEDGILSVRVYFSKPQLRLPYFSFLFNVLRFAGSVRMGLKEIKKRTGRPDIIQLNVASRLGLAAIVLKYLKRIPYIIVEHASTYIKFKDMAAYRKSISLTDRLILSLNYRYADAAAGVSSFLVHGIVKNQNLKKDVFVIPNVVTIPPAHAIRESDSGPLRFLTIALLNKDKNVGELLNAFARVIKDHPGSELHIAGDGSERQNLETQAAGLGLLNKNIFFHGSVPNAEVGRYFDSSDIFILPSKYETFSVVTAEALAHGVPVLITRCGGPEDFVGEEQGLIIEGFDEKSIAEGIEKMIKKLKSYDPEALHEYSRRLFSIEVVSEKLHNVYMKVLSGRKL